LEYALLLGAPPGVSSASSGVTVDKFDVPFCGKITPDCLAVGCKAACFRCTRLMTLGGTHVLKTSSLKRRICLVAAVIGLKCLQILPGGWETLFCLQTLHDLPVGPRNPLYRLLRISHHEETACRRESIFNERLKRIPLNRVGVLELVDEVMGRGSRQGCSTLRAAIPGLEGMRPGV